VARCTSPSAPADPTSEFLIVCPEVGLPVNRECGVSTRSNPHWDVAPPPSKLLETHLTAVVRCYMGAFVQVQQLLQH
jgi:hypothetical protein